VPASGFGVLVMTPFVYRDCAPEGACKLATIYVHRGFLPTPPDGRIPVYDRPEETIRLVGFVRPSEKPGLFQPGNDPARKIWFQRSIEEMAVQANLFGAGKPGDAAFTRFIDREAAPGETAPPIGIDVPEFLKAIPDNHFGYALTWWALAATNVIFLVFFVLARRKPKSAPT
jgi:surfeit locus 1 family protein